MTAQDAVRPSAAAFDDLLANNREFARHFDQQGSTVWPAGVLMVTCMDSRIVPLRWWASRSATPRSSNPGRQVTTSAMAGCIAGVHLLQVDRIMVIPHSRCAMAAADDEVLIERIRQSSGADASWVRFGASADQRRTLHRDVEKLRPPPDRRSGRGGWLLLRRRHRTAGAVDLKQDYASMAAASGWYAPSMMKSLRGPTSLPISISNVVSAISPSSTVIRRRVFGAAGSWWFLPADRHPSPQALCSAAAP